jgi:tRNA/rRNA methyltransferase
VVPGAGPRVILVGPRGGINVGAVCRLIENLAGGELYVVGGEFDTRQARDFAVHAAPVLDAHRRVGTLAEAIAGTSLVVGTTVRGGSYRERTRDIRELAGDIAVACTLAESAGGLPPALVFGPEDRGLENDDVARCHELAYVTTGSAYPSLNLSHAVGIMLYETLIARLALGGSASEQTTTAPRWMETDAGELEAALVDFEQALLTIGFVREDTADHMMQSLRALFGRARMDERDVRVLRGIASQIAWFSNGGHRVLAAKRP